MDKTVVKAIRLLEHLARSAEAARITDLAKELGLMKSNVHRLLKTFESLGYVRRTNEGSYESTLKIWEIGCLAFHHVDIVRLARPHLKWLTEKTGESVHLSKLDNFEVLYIDKIESANPVRAYTEVGGRGPAACTATGKALLAFQPEVNIREAVKATRNFKPHVAISAAELSAAMDEVRHQGFSVNQGEWRANVVGLAAPVLDRRKVAIAAVGISGPGERLKPKALKSFVPFVIEAAARVTSEIGLSASA